jgi:hypothetical protein
MAHSGRRGAGIQPQSQLQLIDNNASRGGNGSTQNLSPREDPSEPTSRDVDSDGSFNIPNNKQDKESTMFKTISATFSIAAASAIVCLAVHVLSNLNPLITAMR